MRNRSSANDTEPTWAFPCRCTDECNTETGACLNEGECLTGEPAQYQWSGKACRTGEYYIF